MSNTTPAATIAAVPKNDVRTPATEFWRKFTKQKLAVGAGIFVLLLVVVAIFAPWIVPFDAENFFEKLFQLDGGQRTWIAIVAQCLPRDVRDALQFSFRGEQIGKNPATGCHTGPGQIHQVHH